MKAEYIGFGILAVPFCIMFLVFGWAAYYTQARVARQLLQRFGFSGNGLALNKPGLVVCLRSESDGDSTRYLIDYEVTVEGLPPTLHLLQEGLMSGSLAGRGVMELKSGDVDFDDFFFITGKGVESLSPAQRSLLLQTCHDLPDSEVRQGKLIGSLVYDQSPSGMSKLVKAVQQMERLQAELRNPNLQPQSVSVGWVSRQQRLQHSYWCWAVAVILGAFSFTYARIADRQMNNLDASCLLIILITAISFVRCGALVRSGSREAVPALLLAHKLTILSSILLLPFSWAHAHSPFGGLVVTVVLGVAAHSGLSNAATIWSRLRLI